MTTIESLKKIYPEINKGYIDGNHNKQKDPGEEIVIKENDKEGTAILETIVHTVRSVPEIIRVMDVIESDMGEDAVLKKEYIAKLEDRAIRLRREQDGERILQTNTTMHGLVFKKGTVFSQKELAIKEYDNGEKVQKIIVTGTLAQDQIINGVEYKAGEQRTYEVHYDGASSMCYVLNGTGVSRFELRIGADDIYGGHVVHPGALITITDGHITAVQGRVVITTDSPKNDIGHEREAPAKGDIMAVILSIDIYYGQMRNPGKKARALYERSQKLQDMYFYGKFSSLSRRKKNEFYSELLAVRAELYRAWKEQYL